jgi:nitric oxide reductase subunit B
MLWSVISVVVLLAGIGATTWYFAMTKQADQEEQSPVPDDDPLRGLAPTPSMRATRKYFWAVTAMLLLQVLMGVVTAHYGVEGGGFYGIPLAQWFPYAVTRTWHIQLASHEASFATQDEIGSI